MKAYSHLAGVKAVQGGAQPPPLRRRPDRSNSQPGFIKAAFLLPKSKNCACLGGQ